MTTTRLWICCGLGVFAAGIVFAVAWWRLASHEELATQRSAYIEGEIAKLKRQVVEIEVLEKNTSFYNMMTRAANLVQHGKTVYAAEALAELSRLPRQIVLTSVTVEKNRLTLIGDARSESDLSQLQPALEQGRFITQVRLTEVGPSIDKRHFRLDAEIAALSISVPVSAEKQK